ncbi:MAG: hypothetical protein HKN77_09760 [Woeseiaceae bacterium]|nr:hypothetical protein [Woeseiaceae bacterium]
MTTDPNQTILRLRKKHAPGRHALPDANDGARIAGLQSMRNAVTSAVIVTILFAIVWAMLSTALARVFPWGSLLLGLVIGFAVRHAGRGFDWRFPTIAAVSTFVGAIVGNIVVGAAYAAQELGTGTFTVLRKVTIYTWPVFFDEVMTAADFVYALFGAGIAAFFATRRLSRRQYHAVRLWKEQQEND